MEYVVRKATMPIGFCWKWDDAPWKEANIGEVASFRPESSDHRPRVLFKAVYDGNGIGVMFRVEDRYVKSTVTSYNGMVCRDSCVEFFVRPKPDKGYFNFETNCGGALLCSYIEDPTRTRDGFRKFTRLPPEDGGRVKVYHSMPSSVPEEISEPVTWFNGIFIPFDMLEKYVGPLGDVSGRRWTANFYKCADGTSHPHWASWSPVSALNFHLPSCFGDIIFEK